MQSLLLLDLHPCILQIRDPNILVVGDELLRRELHLVIEELVQLRPLERRETSAFHTGKLA
jgi:hypothetical protein